MIDVGLAFYFFTSCILGSFLAIKAQNNHLPFYATALSGVLVTAGWMFSVQYTRLSLFQASAVADVMSALGYFVGFYLFGEAITTPQMFGVFFVVVGLYLLNC